MKTNIIFNLKYNDMQIFNEENQISNLIDSGLKKLIEEDFDNLIFTIQSLNISLSENIVSFEIQSDVAVDIYKINIKLDRILLNSLLNFKKYEKYYFEKFEDGLKLIFEVNFNNNMDNL